MQLRGQDVPRVDELRSGAELLSGDDWWGSLGCPPPRRVYGGCRAAAWSRPGWQVPALRAGCCPRVAVGFRGRPQAALAPPPPPPAARPPLRFPEVALLLRRVTQRLAGNASAAAAAAHRARRGLGGRVHKAGATGGGCSRRKTPTSQQPSGSISTYESCSIIHPVIASFSLG